jgi:hypothetical protein
MLLYRRARAERKECAMKLIKILAALVLATALSGCVLTKLVTVPMRVVGAVVSIVPVAGNAAHDGIDAAADVVDEVPI